MLWITVLSILLVTTYCKETQVYEIKGVELIDILRGIPPKGEIQFTKIKGDRSNLPDGIYFEPEDESLADSDPRM